MKEKSKAYEEKFHNMEYLKENKKEYDSMFKKSIFIIIVSAIILITIGIGMYIYYDSKNTVHANDDYEGIPFGELIINTDSLNLSSYSFYSWGDFKGLSFGESPVYDKRSRLDDADIFYNEFDTLDDLNSFLKKIKKEKSDASVKQFSVAGNKVISYKTVSLDSDDDCYDENGSVECVFNDYFYDYYLIKNKSVYFFRFAYIIDLEDEEELSKPMEERIDSFIKSIKNYSGFYDVEEYKKELQKQRDKEIAEDTVYLVESNNVANVYRYKNLSYSIAKAFDDEYNTYSDEVYYSGVSERTRFKLSINYFDEKSEHFNDIVNSSIKKDEKIKTTDKYDVFYYQKDYGGYALYSIYVTDSKSYYYELQLTVSFYKTSLDEDATEAECEAKNKKMLDLAETLKDSVTIINVCSNVCDKQDCECKN